MTDDYFFDVQGLGAKPPEEFAELIAKLGAALIVAWYTVNELSDELRRYRRLRKKLREEAE